MDLPEKITVLGTGISVLSLPQALDLLAGRVAAHQPAVFHAATVYSVMLAYDDSAFRAIVNSGGVVLADGMPLVWLSRALGARRMGRVHGDDLMLAACAANPSWRHFLLGGRAGQPEIAAAALARRFPGITIAGCHATPVRPPAPEESRAIIREIHACGADVVWVGMGTPAQDIWMVDNHVEVGLPMVGVGSAFDLLAGFKKPSPEWVKRSGLQWFHRLLQDPRRLLGRYLRYNPRFILLGLRQLLRGEAASQDR